AARDRSPGRSQGPGARGAGPARTHRCDGLLRHRIWDLGVSCAGDGGAPDDGPGPPGDRAASRRRAAAGPVGAARLRGFRGARVPPRVARVLPARASLGGRPGGRPRGSSTGRMTLMRRTFVVALAALALGATPLAAQYFGQNKVQYRTFDFKVIQTEHFEVYFYDQERAA